MFKILRYNIMPQLLLLIVMFTVCFLGVILGTHLLQKRQTYLQSLLENEQNKIELTHILQKKVLAVNIRMHDLTGASSQPEMSHILKTLSRLQLELQKIIDIIDRGGKIAIKNLISFDFEKSMSRSLEYTPHGVKELNILVLEFRTDLSEIGEIITGLQDIVRYKISALDGHDPLEIAGSIRKVDNFYKGIAPFIGRVLEHSAGLLLQSQQEMDRIRAVNSQFITTYRQIEIAVAAIATALILLAGGATLRSTRKILYERRRYQQELKESNSNLEEIVRKRTSALVKEIAERKNAQDQVMKQADFLLKTIESLSHPFYVIDALDYSIVLANSAARAQREGGNATCFALTHGRNSPCDHISCPLEIIKETREEVVLERVLRNKQGDEIYLEVHGYPIFDKEGKLIQMIEYSLDVTDKKRAEAALQQANVQLEEKVEIRTHELEKEILQRKEAQRKLAKSERHYRRIIENISDIITIVDPEGTMTYISPSAERVLGLSPAQMIGRNIRETVDQEDIKGVDMQTLYDRYGRNGALEYRVRTCSGEFLLLESYVYKFKQDDGRDGYIFSSRDITIRRRSEAETNKLRLVVEQSPSSIVITDKNGTIEYVNPAFERISGYSFAEAVGQNPRVLKSGKTPESAFKQLWATIISGRVWRGEFINKKKNGELYDENVLILPIKDSTGEITNFAAVKENISEIKKAKREAENANRAKSDFLSQMSHELRTPLNAINGFSQLMLKSKKNPLNEKQKSMTEQIHTAGNHLLSLINEILDLARIESREFALSVENVDPKIVINECLSLISPLAQEKQIEIVNNCECESLPYLKADLVRVKQVLLNFLSNAVKYNRPNGKIIIDTDESESGFLKFIISDTGIGIPVEKQQDIFTPFSRAVDNPDEIEGTGIGMAITSQLVEKMGGDLGFDSQLGQGSTFWFMLPVSDADNLPLNVLPPSHTEEQLVSSAHPAIRNILYIEDNQINIVFMEEFFAELDGFQLSCRMTGEEGLVAAKEMLPDLILMDLNLPGIDGFQTFKRLKETEATAEIPVIAVSADVMDKTVKRIQRLGFSGHVPKPVDTLLLYKTILDLLEKKS